MEQFLWLIPLGFIVGTLGTLMGAGGGFILVPILLLMYPEKSPETITSISQAVVFFNALSGSLAYSKMKKIDYKSGLIFAVSAIPGSILGAYSTSIIPRNIFNGVFGVLLVCGAIYLMLKSNNTKTSKIVASKGYITRTITDSEGISYSFSYKPVLGIAFSFFVGYLSSLLGIGGGIIHVPVMVHTLNFPVHIATSTSHFVLVVTSFTASVVHLASGAVAKGILQIVALSIGVIFGAQLGARLSKRFHGVWIIRSLAVALAIVGIRVFITAF